jgi:hypothetical protein
VQHCADFAGAGCSQRMQGVECMREPVGFDDVRKALAGPSNGHVNVEEPCRLHFGCQAPCELQLKSCWQKCNILLHARILCPIPQ